VPVRRTYALGSKETTIPRGRIKWPRRSETRSAETLSGFFYAADLKGHAQGVEGRNDRDVVDEVRDLLGNWQGNTTITGEAS
jgi:hypothetical protein